MCGECIFCWVDGDSTKVWSNNNDGTGQNWLGLQLMWLREARCWQMSNFDFPFPCKFPTQFCRPLMKEKA